LRAAHFDRALDPLPRLLDAVDCITELRRQMTVRRDGAKAVGRLLARFEWRKLLRYEPRAYKPYRAIAVTSEHDARALAALDPLLPPIEVVPNGVDLAYFAPDGTPPEVDSLVFSGTMSYSANDDAARHLIATILPRVRAQRPGVRLTIVGSGPTPGLIRAAAQAGGVEVTGYVDDLRPYLSRSVAALCPMRIGVGIQNKALEAMAMGRPVICSSIAARSLSEARPPAVWVEDNPDKFASACVRILSHADEAKQGGEAARQYVEKYHDWKTAAEAFANLYHVVQRDWTL
jgi:glycosyltransferase involved in cell wall biosynthesis